LHMAISDDNKTVEIWLTQNENSDEHMRISLHLICAKYSKMKYVVVIYRSGGDNVDTGLERLLLSNAKLPLVALASDL